MSTSNKELNEENNEEVLETLAQKPFLRVYAESLCIFIYAEWVYFSLAEPCLNTEELSTEAKSIESEMIELGYEGALIGHPFDESDLGYIRFFIAKD